MYFIVMELVNSTDTFKLNGFLPVAPLRIEGLSGGLDTSEVTGVTTCWGMGTWAGASTAEPGFLTGAGLGGVEV